MNQIQSFFDRITFKQAFIFWICFMLFFGLVYFVLSFSPDNSLLYKGVKLSPSLNAFFISQYFSFITAASASQGYGDVFPLGISRVFAVVEAVCGLLLFGVLITKLVSVKQEHILDEIYGISFDEKIHRIRYSFYLFRVEVNKLLSYFDGGFSRKPFSVLSLVSSFSIALQDTWGIVCVDREFTKNVDVVRLELLIVSIERSFLKLTMLLDKLESKNVSWKNDVTLQKIKSIVELSNKLCAYIASKNVDESLFVRLDNIKKSALRLEMYL